MLEFLRIQHHQAPQHPQISPPTLKAVLTVIILPSLTNRLDARLKGTENFMDHLEEELLSETKIQPDTPVQSELPEMALTTSIMNPTVSWIIMQTCVLGKHAHIFMNHGKAVNIVLRWYKQIMV